MGAIDGNANGSVSTGVNLLARNATQDIKL